MILATAASHDAAPGTLAFLVVFGMAVLLVFVFRSMSKHLRRVNEAARKDPGALSEAPGNPADGSRRGAAGPGA